MEAIRMPADHGWRTQPGYKIVVANRGDARFDVPAGWELVPDETADLCLADAQPPDDDVRLQFTLFPMHLPTVGEDLPTAAELLDDLAGDAWEGKRRGDALSERRNGLDLAWVEADDVDTSNGRTILTRSCLAVGAGRAALFTFACYADRAADFADTWRVLRHSIELGRSYDLSGRDPRRN